MAGVGVVEADDGDLAAGEHEGLVDEQAGSCGGERALEGEMIGAPIPISQDRHPASGRNTRYPALHRCEGLRGGPRRQDVASQDQRVDAGLGQPAGDASEGAVSRGATHAEVGDEADAVGTLKVGNGQYVGS